MDHQSYIQPALWIPRVLLLFALVLLIRGEWIISTEFNPVSCNDGRLPSVTNVSGGLGLDIEITSLTEAIVFASYHHPSRPPAHAFPCSTQSRILCQHLSHSSWRPGVMPHASEIDISAHDSAQEKKLRLTCSATVARMPLPMTFGRGVIWNLSTNVRLSKFRGTCAATSLNSCMLFSYDGTVNGYLT